jgi:nucleoside phosphorylase
MTDNGQFDAAIITVIRPELEAVQKVLAVNDARDRVKFQGTIYWQGQKYSRFHDRLLKLIIACVDCSSQANASIAVTKVIEKFDPAIVILVGIAAGWRDKLKIGDVLVPKLVADFSERVATPEGDKYRPLTSKLPHAVYQMVTAFQLDTNKYHEVFKILFGPPITPKLEQAKDFEIHVTFKPNVFDSPIATQDVLARDPSLFPKFNGYYDGIRGMEMEAGGIVKACINRQPSTSWLVIRGISDFGDTFKNDDFHRLASCSAAAYLDLFLSDGLDLEVIRPSNKKFTSSSLDANKIEQTVNLTTEQPNSSATFSVDIVNEQLDLLNNAKIKEIDFIREDWRTGRNRDALNRLHKIKTESEWRFLTSQVRSKVLRLEASLLLAFDKDTQNARTLILESSKEDPGANLDGLRALVAYHENNLDEALRIVGTPSSLDAWNVRLALLVEDKNVRGTIEEYKKPPNGIIPDSESQRIYALALLADGKADDAFAEAEAAYRLHPNWFSLRQTLAVIKYFLSLSPAILVRMAKNWPAPVDSTFVKRDPQTLKRLREAESMLAELLKERGLANSERESLEGWRLACMANDAERLSQAQNYCAELLDKAPAHPIAIYWATPLKCATSMDKTVETLLAELEQIL